MIPLPIDPLIAEAVAAVRRHHALVVTAAPGTGKSTRLPPALARALPGQVLLLQPRRIAARSLAKRIATEQGWTLGQEVGFQVRHEKVGGPATRLWVLTEGVLTRRLHNDPYLDGVGTVILDEFHERHLHSDVALSWCRELQRTVREDLNLVVMSATIDPIPVQAFLGNAAVVTAIHQPFPVRIEQATGRDPRPLSAQVASAVSERLADPAGGDILVFVAGVGEIRACCSALEGQDATVLPLHGQLPSDEQDRCLSPDPNGRRRVIVSTNVAETSLTIPGVTSVIDTGEHRINRFSAERGLDELRLEAIGQWSAQQRAGRAGRTAAGVCVRLWSQLENHGRPAATDPEIDRVDLAPTLLALKSWGVHDARIFPWFQAPEGERLNAAEELNVRLGLCAAWAGLTPAGKRASRLPTHPRLARLLLLAADLGVPELGAGLAAVCGGRALRLRPAHHHSGPRAFSAPTHTSTCDPFDDIVALEEAVQARFDPRLRDRGIDPNAARELERDRRELLQLIRADKALAGIATADEQTCARLLLAAYPDRVAKRTARDGNRVAMVGGIAAELELGSGLATRSGRPRGELLVAVHIHGIDRRRQATVATMITSAAEISEDDLDAVRPGARLRREQLQWNSERGVIDATVGWWYDDLCLRVAVGNGNDADPTAVAAALATALAPEMDALIAAEPEALSFIMRLRWLSVARPDLDLHVIAPERLRYILDQLCAQRRTRASVSGWLPWLRLEVINPERVDLLAPRHITVPTGNAHALDYSTADAEHPPVLAVRLQELFGLAETPCINNGRTPVLLHLLAPNYRPEQVTRDLASFWTNTYATVRKDLRGRYPRHHWPDDPLTAEPTDRARRRKPI